MTAVTVTALTASSTRGVVLGCHVIITHAHTRHQGLTLVHFSAQLKRFLWDRGCIYGLLWGVLRCWGYQRVFWVYLVSETAQVELRSGGV